jgi:hypothetical protein
MESLYSPNTYPPAVRNQIERLGPLAVEIANRWLRGWPKAVKEHLRTGDYMEFLKAQAEREREAYSQPGNNHLARHEIAELYDLSPKPPMPEIID